VRQKVCRSDKMKVQDVPGRTGGKVDYRAQIAYSETRIHIDGYAVYQALASFTMQVIFAEESKMMRPYDVVG
jgi:hypothetical protein